jgi:hypothetical protein
LSKAFSASIFCEFVIGILYVNKCAKTRRKIVTLFYKHKISLMQTVDFCPLLKGFQNWVLLAHAFNPSYSGGRIRGIMVQSQSPRNRSPEFTMKNPIIRKDWRGESACS